MLEAGQRIGEYILLDPVGSGTFGEVWRARHNAWEKQVVAIKVPTDPEYVRHLQKEGAAIQRLAHHGIVRAIAFDPFAATPYLVMEYVAGINLRSLIQRGPLPLNVATTILRQVLVALDHAHKRGIIHRDIKPENILIHHRALDPVPQWRGAVKLADFGLGKSVRQQSMVFSQDVGGGPGLVGSQPYMAPELFEGQEADVRADLHGCGVVFFEMLTGKRPAGTEVPGDLNPAVSAKLNEVFRRAVARREKRFATPREFLTALSLAVEVPVKRKRIRVHMSRETMAQLTISICAISIVLAFSIYVIWKMLSHSRPGPLPTPPVAVAPMPQQNPPPKSPPRRTPPLANPAATRPAAAAKAAVAPATQVAAAPVNPLTALARKRQARVPGNIFSDDGVPPPTAPVPPSPSPAIASATHGGAASEAIRVVNTADVREAGDVVTSVAANYPDAVKFTKQLDLVKYHDATSMRRNAGAIVEMAGSNAPRVVSGTNNFIMLWGIYERWPAGKYLIVYRVQARSKVTGDNVCFLDVCKNGNTIAQRRPDASEMEKGEWREIPIVMTLKESTEIEFRLWPNEHLLALDRIYIFRVKEE